MIINLPFAIFFCESVTKGRISSSFFSFIVLRISREITSRKSKMWAVRMTRRIRMINDEGEGEEGRRSETWSGKNMQIMRLDKFVFDYTNHKPSNKWAKRKEELNISHTALAYIYVLNARHVKRSTEMADNLSREWIRWQRPININNSHIFMHYGNVAIVSETDCGFVYHMRWAFLSIISPNDVTYSILIPIFIWSHLFSWWKSLLPSKRKATTKRTRKSCYRKKGFVGDKVDGNKKMR